MCIRDRASTMTKHLVHTAFNIWETIMHEENFGARDGLWSFSLANDETRTFSLFAIVSANNNTVTAETIRYKFPAFSCVAEFGPELRHTWVASNSNHAVYAEILRNVPANVRRRSELLAMAADKTNVNTWNFTECFIESNYNILCACIRIVKVGIAK